jgi:hypothetical protein
VLADPFSEIDKEKIVANVWTHEGGYNFGKFSIGDSQ